MTTEKIRSLIEALRGDDETYRDGMEPDRRLMLRHLRDQDLAGINEDLAEWGVKASEEIVTGMLLALVLNRHLQGYCRDRGHEEDLRPLQAEFTTLRSVTLDLWEQIEKGKEQRDGADKGDGEAQGRIEQDRQGVGKGRGASTLGPLRGGLPGGVGGDLDNRSAWEPVLDGVSSGRGARGMIGVRLAAVESDDEDLLSQAFKEAGRALEVDLGAKRISPVTWLRFDRDSGLEMLDQMSAEFHREATLLKEYLQEKPEAVLVVTTAEYVEEGETHAE